MKKVISIILYIVFMQLNLYALELTVGEKNYITENPTVKVALMPDFSPFSYIVDDRVVGFEHDLLELLSQKTGLRFSKEYGIWNKNLRKFKTQQVDMISSISYKIERQPFTLYTKPYYEIPIMIFIRDDFGTYTNLASLKGKRVGVLKDVFYTKEIQQINGIQIIQYETYEEITKSLVLGKIDALVQNLPNVNYLIKKNLYTNLLLADELKLPGIDKEDLRFGINPQQPLLRSIIQKGLGSISKSEWKTLIDRWIDVNMNNINFLAQKEEHKQKYFHKKNKITMCIDPNWMPLEAFDKNGKHIGITADYFKIFEKILHTKFEVIYTKTWSESLGFAKSRKCDILSLAMETPKRSQYLNFTTPYLSIPLVIATKLDIPFINDIGELSGYNIGIPKGYAFSEFIKNKYSKINIIEVANIDEGLEKVRNGELHAYIGTLTSVGYKIQNEYLGELKITGKVAEKWELGIGVRNDDPNLLSFVQQAIDSLTKEQHTTILKKWVAVKYENNVDYTLVWEVLTVSVFILLLFGYWNRKITVANTMLKEAKKEIELKNQELEKLAVTDKLTGLFNRAKIDEILEVEIQRNQRFNHSFSICIVDIDHFKRVNDAYGHQEGDKVLKAFADLLKNNIRKTDFLGRWGGEEFVIICPETDKEGILHLMETLREIVEKHQFGIVGQKTASFGIAISSFDDASNTIMLRADQALYEAKKGGRNKVVIKTL